MRLIGSLVLLLMALPVSPARAAAAYDNCIGFIDSLPAVITTQGVWCLRQDLSTALDSGVAIEVGTNNVTIECNGFKLGGLAAGPLTLTRGIRSSQRLNTTIRGCTFRGFLRGVHLLGGAGHLVEGNRFEANTYTSISVSSANSIIRDNHVLDAGGSTADPNFAIGILCNCEGVSLIANTINGLIPTDPSTEIFGIYYSGDGIIGGNRITGFPEGLTGRVMAIFSETARTVIHDNTAIGPVVNTGTTGIRCLDTSNITSGNRLIGFETGLDGCLAADNIVAD